MMKQTIGPNAQSDAFYIYPSEAAHYRNARGGKGTLPPMSDGDAAGPGVSRFPCEPLQ
ncbi:MAG: hypothetical protein IK108_02600 [Clostridia bacterium]|nr:hypothetical protein [Clostridia bacterium]